MFLITCWLYPLTTFLFYLWLFIFHIGDHFYDFACDEYDAIEPAYDYIVVGAGSAGVVAALRLADDEKVSVLLIEAGFSSSILLNIPALGPLVQGSFCDWAYETEPQENACLGLKNKRSKWPMGRLVGGTARLNNMIYFRGNSRDYDSWSAAKNPTWGYNEQARFYFKKSERQRGRYVNDTLDHSSDGLWHVSDLFFTTPLSKAVIEGGVEMGYNVNDLNGKNQTGFMEPQISGRNGSRPTIDKIVQKSVGNIRLIINTVVEKILFRNGFEAVGVRIFRLGKRRKVKARKSVILTAGVIGSPKLLMLSGIGPRQHLEKLGIKVIRDLPVGQNLQDHLTTGLDLITLDQALPFSLETLLNPIDFYNYFRHGTGAWTFPGCEAIAAIYTRLADPAVDPPDLQLMALPAGVSSDRGTVIRKNMGISDQLWEEYFWPLVGRQVVSILPVLLHPKSRGEVLLRSGNPQDPPIINPRYLTDPYDVEVLLEGIHVVKRLIATQPMQALGAKLYTKPLPGCEQHVFDTRPYWECYVRHLTITSYHPVGTCKMGPESDPTTVVDSFLRVHGMHRLRVMDASVMPTIVSGNVNAAVMMIAERGIDLIKNYWHSITRVCWKIEIFIPRVTTWRY